MCSECSAENGEDRCYCIMNGMRTTTIKRHRRNLSDRLHAHRMERANTKIPIILWRPTLYVVSKSYVWNHTHTHKETSLMIVSNNQASAILLQLECEAIHTIVIMTEVQRRREGGSRRSGQDIWIVDASTKQRIASNRTEQKETTKNARKQWNAKDEHTKRYTRSTHKSGHPKSIGLVGSDFLTACVQQTWVAFRCP